MGWSHTQTSVGEGLETNTVTQMIGYLLTKSVSMKWPCMKVPTYCVSNFLHCLTVGTYLAGSPESCQRRTNHLSMRLGFIWPVIYLISTPSFVEAHLWEWIYTDPYVESANSHLSVSSGYSCMRTRCVQFDYISTEWVIRRWPQSLSSLGSHHCCEVPHTLSKLLDYPRSSFRETSYSLLLNCSHVIYAVSCYSSVPHSHFLYVIWLVGNWRQTTAGYYTRRAWV